MRKRYRVLLLAAIVAAVVVPVGFALSLEAPPVGARAAAPMVVATSAVTAPALVRTAPGVADVSVPEGAKLFAVGTMLCGLAAAVRRAA